MRISKAIANAKQERLATLRKTLGDVIVASIYRRRLAALTATELVQAQADAAPGFEATLVSELAITELQTRTAGKPDAPIRDLQALAELQGRTVSPELRRLEAQAEMLRSGDGWLTSLDLVAHRNSVA